MLMSVQSYDGWTIPTSTNAPLYLGAAGGIFVGAIVGAQFDQTIVGMIVGGALGLGAVYGLGQIGGIGL